jgi:hypothetical protein
MRPMPDAGKAAWASFAAERVTLTEAEIEAEIERTTKAADTPVRRRGRQSQKRNPLRI